MTLKCVLCGKKIKDNSKHVQLNEELGIHVYPCWTVLFVNGWNDDYPMVKLKGSHLEVFKAPAEKSMLIRRVSL